MVYATGTRWAKANSHMGQSEFCQKNDTPSQFLGSLTNPNTTRSVCFDYGTPSHWKAQH